MDGILAINKLQDDVEHEDEEKNADFNTRCYQQELFECAVKKNSILVLGTGSGKTFISILLIKEFGDAIRGIPSDGSKRTIFVVNTVPLVHQQALAIGNHTPFKVGLFEGSMGVDFWSVEKWKEEIDKHEVLVMVAEIFKNLILHSRLPLTKVNLIIMDECHHATGNHPMREIMQEYAVLKKANDENPSIELPRILGLTACVIHRKCKESDVLKLMKCLENTMDSSLVTSVFQDIVKLHTTRPVEMIIEYLEKDRSSLFSIVSEKLEIVHEEVFNYIDKKLFFNRRDYMQDKKKKFVNKILTGIKHSLIELGDYILQDALELEAQYLLEAEADSEDEQEINKKFAECLLEVIRLVPTINKSDPLNCISSKVKRLLEVLAMYSNQSTEVRILVFVERRNTSKLLHSLLLAVKDLDPNLHYLSPESIVGGTTNIKDDLKVKQEIENQKKIMAKFRRGECNIIFSTSVLEEGIDVQKCNAVIRFDKPKNFRSYVQSLGRARAVPSKYIMLAKESENESLLLKDEIRFFKKILALLLNQCHDRPLPKMDDILNSFQDDSEVEPAYIPYGIPGPKITFNSAIQLINKYCGTLPHDKFTQLTVTVKFKHFEKDIQAFLTLPRNSKFKESLSGNIKSNKDYAKKSAALALCKKLHEIGELDNNLLPRRMKVDSIICKNLVIESEIIDIGKPQAGTRKRRQVYERFQCSYFSGSDLNEMYLHYIGLEFGTNVWKNNDKKIGLLCAKPLTSCEFHLYSNVLGKVTVNVQCTGKFSFTEDTIKNIKHFHMVTYRLLLNLNKGIMVFDPEDLHHTVLIVPLTTSLNIDTQFLDVISKFSSIEDLTHSGSSSFSENSYKFNANSYENAVIIPTYRDPQCYIVEKILHDLTPLSEFPENKKRYGSYKDYYKIQYSKEICNLTQSLLQCRQYPKELNHLKLKPNSRPSKDNSNQHPIFVPELCRIFPYSVSLWWQVTLIPSVLHRLNGLLLERELFDLIHYNPTPINVDNFVNKTLDFGWCQKEVQNSSSKSSNLVAILKNKDGMSIYPGMILQTLSPVSVGDNFNLERLEVLGDSFLKFSVSVHLFCKETEDHEGKLTLERSHIVSNKTLYTLSKAKKITGFYQGFALNRANVIPYGFKILEDLEMVLRAAEVDPTLWMTYFKESETKTSEPCESSHHPWNEQIIPDKCIADCCESLIGLYLLNGGEKAARHFMMWLGFEFLNENCSPPRTAVIKSDTDPSQITKVYRKFCLDQLEDILHYKFKNKSFLIQAVTHPSDVQNKITDCYQRLEFLGDAVLDYLITGYIFAEYEHFDPGDLTDLRSHFVKNETLARAAIKLELNKYLLHASPKLNTAINIFMDLIKDGEKEFNTEDDTLEAEDVEVPKALGDLVEALLGAIYIDSRQSLEICWKVIRLILEDEFICTQDCIPINHVRKLFEKMPSVNFELIKPTEELNKASCIVKMEGFPPYTGTGKNLRTAKLAAAKLALFHLNKNNQK